MKKIILSMLCIFTCSCFGAVTHAGLFKKENVQVYDLANLESDLKKDYVEKDFEEGGVCDWREGKTCNAFQTKKSDDETVRSFITNLKEGKKKNAADIFNSVKYDKYGNTNTKLYPIEIANFFSISYGVIPFHNGVLGIVNEGQAGFFKFFYMTVQNNNLIRVKMDTDLMPQIPTSKDNPKTSTITLVGRNAKGEEIDRFDFAMNCTYTEDTKTDTRGVTCDEKEAFRKYLFGITKNKAFDEWRTAYQKKIKSIKSFSKL